MFDTLIKPGFDAGWKLKKDFISLSDNELEKKSFHFACEYGFGNLDMLSEDFEDHVLIIQKVYKDAFLLSDSMIRPGTSFMFDRAFSYYNEVWSPDTLINTEKLYRKEQQQDKSLYKLEIINAYKAGWFAFKKLDKKTDTDELFTLALEYSLYPNGKYKITIRDNKRTRISIPAEKDQHKIDFIESAFIDGFHNRRLIFGLHPRQEKFSANQAAQKYYSSL